VEELNIRPVREDDAAAIAAIYNHYVASSTATFDTDAKTEADRRQWISARSDRHPVIVGEQGSRLVAYAALSPWSQRPAWGDTVELGVYVAEDRRGAGVGAQMVDAAVAAAREAAHHAVLAQVVGGNEASLRLLTNAGFEIVGTMREVGNKFSQRLDVVLLELVL
jgi:phosphinothricin acetyltransferase